MNGHMVTNTVSAENFIMQTPFLQELSSVLLKTKSEHDDFYSNYLGSNPRIVDDLLDYRDFRINTSKVSKVEFIDMLDSLKLKEVFEKVFLQHFSNHDVEFIQHAISEHNITLCDIFDNFIRNPTKNIMRYVL